MEDSATNSSLDDVPSTTTPPPPPLPILTHTPTVRSGCCLALSTPLVTLVRSLLPPPPALALSIGSGFGLLEALLLALPPTAHLIGVEVDPSPNIYLPPASHRTVHGTRFLEPLAGEAATWLFVYPRRVGLVNEYLAQYARGSVRQLIWIGPRADWEDYESCFGDWDTTVQGADEVGGRAWELVVVATKRQEQSEESVCTPSVAAVGSEG